MTFQHILVIFSAVIALLGSSAYIKDTISGKSKPNRISWLMWTLAPMVATVAALATHADLWTTSRTFLAGFVPLLILIASFLNKKSYWKITLFDSLCGALSLVAVIIWLFANSPVIAVLIAAVGDCFAAIPTIIKSWKYPETETGLTYFTGLVSVILVLPSVPKWNIQNSAFQIYLLLVNTILLLSIYRKGLPFFKKS